MPPILTLTLNPALDMATTTPAVVPTEKLRCTPPRIDPGGGGVNVARAMRILGGEALALVAAGGPTGGQLLALLAQEGVLVGPLPAPGDTRISLAVRDQASGEQYRFMLPGPAWSDRDLSAVMPMIESALTPGACCVLSGSQPPGLADNFPADFARLCADRQVRLVVDTAGAPLAALAAAPGPGVEVLRLNLTEAATLAGRSLATATECADFAGTLVARGVARMVVLARGGEGAVLASGGGRWQATAPEVAVISRIGAGDSMVAAFILALSRGAAPEEALRQSVAAAAAAMTSEGTGLFRRAEVKALAPRCRVERL